MRNKIEQGGGGGGGRGLRPRPGLEGEEGEAPSALSSSSPFSIRRDPNFFAERVRIKKSATSFLSSLQPPTFLFSPALFNASSFASETAFPPSSSHYRAFSTSSSEDVYQGTFSLPSPPCILFEHRQHMGINSPELLLLLLLF